jgi:hypothetical protein
MRGSTTLVKLAVPMTSWRGHLVQRYSHEAVVGTVFCVALFQFIILTWVALDQPILDMWGFRPAQTAVSVPYMLHGGALLANVVPVFGEPWILPQEFPFFQWCVALMSWVTKIEIGSCGRTVSAIFTLAAIWPIVLLAGELTPTKKSRVALLVSSLWLLSPVVVFWGRSFLIETTIVFLSLGWLAFYVRFLNKGGLLNYSACLAFGVLAASVKVTALAGFVVAGFFYSCFFLWMKRSSLKIDLQRLLFAGLTLVFSAGSLFAWSAYTDSFMRQNPLASMLRVSSMPAWYFGVWSDRWSKELWDWAIRLRDLPEALGSVWFVPVLGLIYAAFRGGRGFWLSLALIVSYLSVYMFFPKLHMYNAYYQVENVILLCAAVAVVIEILLRNGNVLIGYGILGITISSQIYGIYAGDYGPLLFEDLHKHPYYQAALKIKEATPLNSVVVGFGMGWGADVPFYAERRGIILPNWAPSSTVHEMLFEDRDRWLGGRSIGAVVDCSVFGSQQISASLEPIRDELFQELGGKVIEIKGTVVAASASPPECRVVLANK